MKDGSGEQVDEDIEEQVEEGLEAQVDDNTEEQFAEGSVEYVEDSLEGDEFFVDGNPVGGSVEEGLEETVMEDHDEIVDEKHDGVVGAQYESIFSSDGSKQNWQFGSSSLMQTHEFW